MNINASLLSCSLALVLAACQEVETQPQSSRAEGPVATTVAQIADISKFNLQGGVYGGGAPSAGQMQVFADQGVKTVFDFRTEAEGVGGQRQVVRALGLNYINIPLTGVLATPAQIAKFGQAFALAKQDKVVLHCRSGNRVGMMWSLYQISQGVSSEQAISEGRAFGMKPGFEGLVRASVKPAI